MAEETTTADDETNMITITEETSGKFDQLFHSLLTNTRKRLTRTEYPQ